jgi:hypothetical protein
MQLVMIAGFYLASWARRPGRAFAFLRAQFGGREETYLDQMVRTKRRKIEHLTRRDARRAARRPAPAANSGAESEREPAAAGTA